MAETLKAKLHRVIGGSVCANRGHHRLVLAEQVWHERTGATREAPIDGLPSGSLTLHEVEQRRERRPVCLTCWQMPGD